MKVLVMGSGGVGGYYGGVISKSGHDVIFVARGEHLNAIKENGLRVESVNSGNFTLYPRVTSRLDGVWKADIVLFCVKSYDNSSAIRTMAPSVGPETAILTLQNGLGSADDLGEAFGREKVILGVTYIDGIKKKPGVVCELNAASSLIFGEEDGSETERVAVLRDVFWNAEVEVELSNTITVSLWKKLLFICGLSGMTCITNASLAEILDTPGTLDLTWRVLREAEAVARAKGVALGRDVVEASMARFQERKDTMISSMKVDLDRGNPLEVGVLNGAVSKIGKKVRVSTPVNDFITSCLNIHHRRAISNQGMK